MAKRQGEISSYGAKDIQVLEGLQAVRRRPGMYVGGTDIKALHHLIYEVVDNSIDGAIRLRNNDNFNGLWVKIFITLFTIKAATEDFSPRLETTN